MKRRLEYLIFFTALACLLVLSFYRHLPPAHSIYLILIEDPGPRLSYYPWLVHSARSFRQGFFPLWNHLSGTGFPHLANFQSTPFNPFFWCFYLFPSLAVIDAAMILRLALAGLFTFMFLRRVGLGPPAAAAGSAAFAFSGYLLKNLNQVNLYTEMWIPLILYLIHGQIKNRLTFRRLALSVLVCSLAFIGGNPEAAFYFIIIAVIYALFILDYRDGNLFKKALCVLGSFAAAFMLASAQLWPFLEYLGQGWHIHTGKLHMVADFSPAYFFTLIMPWLKGPYRTHGFQVFTLPYIGIICAFLAITALIYIKKNQRTLLFCMFYILVFLCVIWRIPPISWINYLPGFSQSGNVKFAMAGVTFCFAVAAALGLDRIIKGEIAGKRLSIAFGIITALAFVSVGMAVLDRHHPGLYRPGYLIPVCFFIASGFMVLAGRKRQKFPKAMSWTIAGLIVIELMVLFKGYKPMSEIDRTRWRFDDPVPPAYLEPLKKFPVPDRFTGDEAAIKHSLNILYGLNDIRAFEALYPKDYVAAMAKIEGFEMNRGVEAFFNHGWSFYISPENLDHDLVDILGVRYAFLSSAAAPARGWAKKSSGALTSFENKEPLPRAFCSKSVENLDIIKEAGVKFLSYGPEKVSLVAVSPEPGFLVLSDTFCPGWKALVDDKPEKIEKALELVRAVHLPPGRHEVEIFYEPWSFRIGLWTTLSALLALALLSVYKHFANTTKPSRQVEIES